MTNKDVVLWDDILQAFEDALHVRHQAMIVPFVKGSDLRTYVLEAPIFQGMGKGGTVFNESHVQQSLTNLTHE